jgi:hypothetical protein
MKMKAVEIPFALSLADRMQRGDLFAEKCPSREVLKHVTSRWGVLLLVALLSGTQRFSDLRRKVNGISEKCWRKPYNGWKRMASLSGFLILWCRRMWNTR